MKETEPVREIDLRGTATWTLNGALHRDDGPAIKWANGTKMWYRDGQCHRDNGPAIVYPDGQVRWFLNGREYTKREWLREILKDRPLTKRQRKFLNVLSENWAGTPELLYETATQLCP